MPERPALFELFLNDTMYRYFAGHGPEAGGDLGTKVMVIDAMAAAGYDYATSQAPGFFFPEAEHEHRSTISINDRAVITDWESYEKYPWPDPEQADYTVFDRIKPYLPEGRKLMVMGPEGVLENGIKLIG